MVEEKRWIQRYAYAVLQTGSLPLAPNAGYDPTIEHRCTSTLIWPDTDPPSLQNTVITDPSFTSLGYEEGLRTLGALGMTFQEIAWIFVTHPHRDHTSNLDHFMTHQSGKPFRKAAHPSLANFGILSLPGHAPGQKGVLFRAAPQHMVCVSGDAILDEAWLRTWKYYWPNFYQEPEIIQTWRSVAAILARATLVIPGHGAPFEVTPDLLDHLGRTFGQAEHAGKCPDVLEILEKRYDELSKQV